MGFLKGDGDLPRLSYAVSLLDKVKYRGEAGEAFAQSSKWGKGDTLGLLLDVEAGVLSGFLNGEPLGVVFTEAVGKDEAAASSAQDWSEGMYPALRIGAGEGVSVNVGQEPFRSQPDNVLSLLQAAQHAEGGSADQHRGSVTAARAVVAEFSHYNNGDWAMLPPLLLPLEARQEAERSGGGFSCYVAPSLRLCVEINGTESQSREGAALYTSQRPLLPGTWAHVGVLVDRYTLELHVDRKSVV